MLFAKERFYNTIHPLHTHATQLMSSEQLVEARPASREVAVSIPEDVF